MRQRSIVSHFHSNSDTLLWEELFYFYHCVFVYQDNEGENLISSVKSLFSRSQHGTVSCASLSRNSDCCGQRMLATEKDLCLQDTNSFLTYFWFPEDCSSLSRVVAESNVKCVVNSIREDHLSGRKRKESRFQDVDDGAYDEGDEQMQVKAVPGTLKSSVIWEKKMRNKEFQQHEFTTWYYGFDTSIERFSPGSTFNRKSERRIESGCYKQIGTGGSFRVKRTHLLNRRMEEAMRRKMRETVYPVLVIVWMFSRWGCRNVDVVPIPMEYEGHGKSE